MKILINSKLVAKCMNETAKECGMTRLYSSTDNIWQAKANELIGHNFLDNPGKWVEAKEASLISALLKEKISSKTALELLMNGLSIKRYTRLHRWYLIRKMR